MSSKPYTVHIIVDDTFGEKLKRLPDGEPVWIVDSPTNTAVAHRLWAERRAPSHLRGSTTFNPTGTTAEENLLGELDMIDLHHGQYSADPPYGVAIVYGVSPTPEIVQAFAGLGFHRVTSTPDGFVATRAAAPTLD